jgi:hypothetical protein
MGEMVAKAILDLKTPPSEMWLGAGPTDNSS